MGKKQSKPNAPVLQQIRQNRNRKFTNPKSRHGVLLKSIYVIAEKQFIKVVVFDPDLTCGWLLSETKRQYTGSKQIVALKTKNDIETLDYWLTQYDRKLQPLQDNVQLLPVFYEAVDPPIAITHFVPNKFIGEGGFSKVMQIRKKNTGELFACKVMKKEFILDEGKVSQIINEKDIMSGIDHPFLVNLYWTFQSATELYMIMELCVGGEMAFHLHQLGRFSEDQAKFYFCEILLGVEYLHSLGIAYRDMKPENVLIDIDGHIRLTDFGLSKQEMYEQTMSKSFCGSPEYMAPEMLMGKEHSRAVDFYHIGVILFEMLVGAPPFFNDNIETMHRAIVNQPLILPNFMSGQCKDLLQRLLEKNPEQRLGYHGGISDIKNHQWVRQADWDSLLEKKLDPPFKPSVHGSNFDPKVTSVELEQFIFDLDEELEFPIERFSDYEENPFFGFEYNSEEKIRPKNSIFNGYSPISGSVYKRRILSKTLHENQRNPKLYQLKTPCHYEETTGSKPVSPFASVQSSFYSVRDKGEELNQSAFVRNYDNLGDVSFTTTHKNAKDYVFFQNDKKMKRQHTELIKVDSEIRFI